MNLKARLAKLEQKARAGDDGPRVVVAPANGDGTYTLQGERVTREELSEYIEAEFGPGSPVVVVDF